MRIDFSERFALPAGEVFSYFSSPANWGRIFGFAGVRDLGAGWFAVGLKGFPFPLVAKTTAIEPNRLVRWRFRGFWRGEGEVRFTSSAGTVLLEGHEEIGVRYLYFLSPIVEGLLLESRFRAIWALGWRRLRSLEPKKGPGTLPGSSTRAVQGAHDPRPASQHHPIKATPQRR